MILKDAGTNAYIHGCVCMWIFEQHITNWCALKTLLEVPACPWIGSPAPALVSGFALMCLWGDSDDSSCDWVPAPHVGDPAQAHSCKRCKRHGRWGPTEGSACSLCVSKHTNNIIQNNKEVVYVSLKIALQNTIYRITADVLGYDEVLWEGHGSLEWPVSLEPRTVWRHWWSTAGSLLELCCPKPLHDQQDGCIPGGF